MLNLIMVYTLIWGEQGLIAYNELKTEVERLKQHIVELDSRNVALSQEIRLLQSDSRYIEKMIRKRMNFVKKDEVLYIFPEKMPQNVSGAASDERED